MNSKKKAVKKKIAALPAVKVVMKKSPRPRAKAEGKTTISPTKQTKAEKPAQSKTVASVKAAKLKSALPKTKTSQKRVSQKIPNQKSIATKPRESAKKTEVAEKAPRSEVARKAVAEAMAAAPEIKSPAAARTPVREVSKTFSAPPKPPARKTPERIPAILFEGDKPDSAPVSGPGQRYALGPLPPSEKFAVENELPKSYGTQRLFLAARDPNWLYAHWDLTDEQLRDCNARSIDHHLILRIHEESISAAPVQEIHLHPESRHWFVHVERAGVKYVAEIGFYISRGRWTAVAVSSPTLTPPDKVSSDVSAEFATIPFELPMEKLLSLVKEAVQENVPLAEALREVRAEEFSELPELPTSGATLRSHAEESKKFQQAPTEWTKEQEKALEKIISMDHVRRVWMGSLEITEVIRRQAMQEMVASAAAALPDFGKSAPTSPGQAPGAVGAISSPVGMEQKSGKGFWFNVNAELIIYGATETDATVTIAGRKIRLRPDGSFSYRFALPDGNYELPIVAVSADQTDGRAAELTFSRSTEMRGEVGIHPQDSNLKRPEATSL